MQAFTVVAIVGTLAIAPLVTATQHDTSAVRSDRPMIAVRHLQRQPRRDITPITVKSPAAL